MRKKTELENLLTKAGDKKPRSRMTHLLVDPGNFLVSGNGNCKRFLLFCSVFGLVFNIDTTFLGITILTKKKDGHSLFTFCSVFGLGFYIDTTFLGITILTKKKGWSLSFYFLLTVGSGICF